MGKINWRGIRLSQEAQLSPLAARSSESRGRLIDEPECHVRSLFERDANRILYSEDFRRLRHKTQVFFNAKNDHVCTRMEHVLYVNSYICDCPGTRHRPRAFRPQRGEEAGRMPE